MVCEVDSVFSCQAVGRHCGFCRSKMIDQNWKEQSCMRDYESDPFTIFFS